MSKWFDKVIEDYVSKNEFNKNYKIIVKGLSDKQQAIFIKNMNPSENIKYYYDNERYHVEMYTNSFWGKRSIVIFNTLQSQIDSYKTSIKRLHKELQEETNEEYRQYIKEDIEEDTLRLNKLLEMI